MRIPLSDQVGLRILWSALKPPLHLSRSKPFWNNGPQREGLAGNLLRTKKSYRYPEQTGENVENVERKFDHEIQFCPFTRFSNRQLKVGN